MIDLSLTAPLIGPGLGLFMQWFEERTIMAARRRSPMGKTRG